MCYNNHSKGGFFMLKLTYCAFEQLPCLIDSYELVRLLTPTVVVKMSYGMSKERIEGLSQKQIENFSFPLDFCEIAEQTFLYTMPKIEGQNLAMHHFNDLYHLSEIFEEAMITLKESHRNDVYPADIHEGNLIITNHNHIGMIDLDEAGFDDMAPIDHWWHKKYLKPIYDLSIDNFQKYRMINKFQLLHMFLSAIHTGICHLDYKQTTANLSYLEDDVYKYFTFLLSHPASVTDNNYLEEAIYMLRKNKNIIYKE